VLLKKYKEELLSSIPVVSSMDVDIVDVGPTSIVLTAPLNTNINYEGTAFGGSLNTLCILSSYLLVHHILKQAGIGFNSLVIQNSEVEYLKPVDGDFSAQASLSVSDEKLFYKLMNKKGIGRVTIISEIKTNQADDVRVRFKGRFVATK
jgi:thioesterase domain-containing protein